MNFSKNENSCEKFFVKGNWRHVAKNLAEEWRIVQSFAEKIITEVVENFDDSLKSCEKVSRKRKQGKLWNILTTFWKVAKSFAEKRNTKWSCEIFWQSLQELRKGNLSTVVKTFGKVKRVAKI